MDCTLVTAYYPIKSKFPSNQYLKWATQFMQLKSPIVLFTPVELTPIFQSMRPHGLPMQVYNIPFTDLHMWKTYADQWRLHHKMDHENNIHTPELYAIWAQKAVFIDDAIKANPFKTDHFFWCDIGAFRDEHINPVICASFPTIHNLPKDKIAICSVTQLEGNDNTIIDEIHGNFQHTNRIVGGLWGGDITGCLKWRLAFEECLRLYFEKGRFAGKDQSVMLSTYLANPTLANVYKPPNKYDWFYFQRLHSNLDIVAELDRSYIC
jgi:hypothetical protein